MFLLILFGDKGLADLNLLKKSHYGLQQKNMDLVKENMGLYRAINRLKSDPVYIESVARQELGVVKKSEIIYKMDTRKARER